MAPQRRSKKCVVAGLGGTPIAGDQLEDAHLYGCFQKFGYPKMDGLSWKTLLKWMIKGYQLFRKHPYG